MHGPNAVSKSHTVTAGRHRGEGRNQRRAPACAAPGRSELPAVCRNHRSRAVLRRRGPVCRVDPIHHGGLILRKAHCDEHTSPDKGALGRVSLETGWEYRVLMGAAPDRRSRWSRAPPPCLGCHPSAAPCRAAGRPLQVQPAGSLSPRRTLIRGDFSPVHSNQLRNDHLGWATS